MKEITDFNELKNGKRFIVFNKDGEYNLFTFFGEEPNNIDSYAYFFNTQTKDVIRLHDSIVNLNECFEMEKYDSIAVNEKRIQILQKKIEYLRERINKEKKEQTKDKNDIRSRLECFFVSSIMSKEFDDIAKAYNFKYDNNLSYVYNLKYFFNLIEIKNELFNLANKLKINHDEIFICDNYESEIDFLKKNNKAITDGYLIKKRYNISSLLYTIEENPNSTYPSKAKEILEKLNGKINCDVYVNYTEDEYTYDENIVAIVIK